MYGVNSRFFVCVIWDWFGLSFAAKLAGAVRKMRSPPKSKVNGRLGKGVAMKIRRKWRKLAVIFSSMSFVLLEFQNCAPAPSNVATGTAAPGESRVADGWNTQLKLIDSVTQAGADLSSISVDGLCSAGFNVKEDLNWQLLEVPSSSSRGSDLPENVVMEGHSVCERGGFRLVIAQLQSLNCDQSYEVRVRTAAGQEDKAYLLRNCTF